MLRERERPRHIPATGLCMLQCGERGRDTMKKIAETALGT